MKIGDQIVATEAVFVYDEIGLDLFLTGTEGTVAGITGDLLAMQTAKGLYESVPVSCVRLKKEEDAA